MPKGASRPKDALVLHSYEQLRQYVEAFARGHLNLLILVGPPGVAKSRSLDQAVGRPACWIEGNVTPIGMYMQLYKHRDQLIVIDDVDGLFANPTSVRLLKCLCQTNLEKRVAWMSAASVLDREEIPREFVTRSRVAIISNDWTTLNQNVQAVQDRGHVLVFEPTAAEVHRQVAEWFWDQEIYDWLGAHLHLLAEPSMRHYVRAAELKAAGMDWLPAVPLKTLSAAAQLVLRLKADPGYPSEEARAQAFIVAGGGCRATYFNQARKLGGSETVPACALPLKAAQKPRKAA